MENVASQGTTNQTRVVNRRFEQFDVYIGRMRDIKEHFGNPFSHKPSSIAHVIRVATREDSIRCFEHWLLGLEFQEVEPERRKWILANLNLLKGKRLGCYCKPLACHGDILRELCT